MSEREEYTPDLGSIRAWYAGAVDEYRCDTGMSVDEAEAAFDRAIAAHDRALREQIAREILDRACRYPGYLTIPFAEIYARIARGGADR